MKEKVFMLVTCLHLIGTDEDIYPEKVDNHQGERTNLIGIETNLELTQGDN